MCGCLNWPSYTNYGFHLNKLTTGEGAKTRWGLSPVTVKISGMYRGKVAEYICNSESGVMSVVGDADGCVQCCKSVVM